MGAVTAPASRALLGREEELAELSTSLGLGGSAPATAGAAVLLAGDAGVGKTRLLLELCDRARAEGWTVLAGHCLDFGDSALPYLPFSEVLGRLAADRPADVEEAMERFPALARLLPGRRMLGSAAEDAGVVDRGELFEAVHTLLAAIGESAPLLLVVEDAHWADQSTRDLLGFLFSRPFPTPVVLVASYRSDDLHRRHPLRRQVAEWTRIRGVQRMSLGPLAEDAVRALVAELVPRGLAPEAVAEVVARSEGNPFFVEELASATAEPGRWVPADLAEVLLVRLDRLDDAARAVVRTASASGRRVSHALLAAVSGLPETSLDQGLRQAVEMNVLVALDGDYSFRHALLGEAVHDDLLPGERARLHGRYVAALRDGAVRGTAAELARHARLAGDLDTALTASVQAGDEAARVGGPGEAAYHYQQALGLLADPQREAAAEVDAVALAVKAAVALGAFGDPQRAVALLGEQLDRLPADAPPVWRCELLCTRADLLIVVDTEEDPTEVSAEALALAPDGANRWRARALCTHARMLAGVGRYEEAQAVGVEALELSERLDLHELAADAITTLSGLKRAGPKEGVREALAEAVERSAAIGALQAELRARFLLGRSYQDWAEWEEAERWFASAMELGSRAGLTWAPFVLESRMQLAWIRFVRGAWDEVLALAEHAGEHAPPIPRALLDALRMAVEVGRGGDVRGRARELRRFWAREGAVALHSVELEVIQAGREGDALGALEVYDAAVSVLARTWHPWFSARIRFGALALGAVAESMPRLSAAERAALIPEAERIREDGATVLRTWSDPSGHWGPEGRAWRQRLDAETLRLRWLADVDPPGQEELLGAWAETATLFADFGHVFELARVRTAYAGILRATGDPDSAREQADLARAAARELGAQPLLDELRALGSTPVRTAAGAGANSLTPRETEILELVAAGRSNGEIGRQLFISAKTVSVHVSNILAKLGAAGRTEAAAIARRRGLLD